MTLNNKKIINLYELIYVIDKKKIKLPIPNNDIIIYRNDLNENNIDVRKKNIYVDICDIELETPKLLIFQVEKCNKIYKIEIIFYKPRKTIFITDNVNTEEQIIENDADIIVDGNNGKPLIIGGDNNRIINLDDDPVITPYPNKTLSGESTDKILSFGFGTSKPAGTYTISINDDIFGSQDNFLIYFTDSIIFTGAGAGGNAGKNYAGGGGGSGTNWTIGNKNISWFKIQIQVGKGGIGGNNDDMFGTDGGDTKIEIFVGGNNTIPFIAEGGKSNKTNSYDGGIGAYGGGGGGQNIINSPIGSGGISSLLVGNLTIGNGQNGNNATNNIAGNGGDGAIVPVSGKGGFGVSNYAGGGGGGGVGGGNGGNANLDQNVDVSGGDATKTGAAGGGGAASILNQISNGGNGADGYVSIRFSYRLNPFVTP